MSEKLESSKYLFFCIALMVVAISCKQPETITINADPVSAPNTDTASTDTATASQSADFMQLNMGELHAIHSLDPVFAKNTSTMRALQLLYEGLVKYNEEGNITPAVAKTWSVSDDSLTYTFTLQDDAFYQDSDIFPNGIGRKLVARDVRFVFERLAKATVPPHGAELFMSVLGFEPYFQEQHNVYNPEERKLPTIRGIATPNDSTVSFRLQDKDPHFIQKLASPYALIYPREAVRSNNFTPIGSGPYKLSQVEGQTRFIFSKFKNYHGEAPGLNRIDIITGQSESELFQSFVRGEIDFIPEMGPQMLKGLMADRNNLKPVYQNQYKLYRNSGRLHYIMHYNDGSDYSRTSAIALAQLVDSTTSITETGDFIDLMVMQKDSANTAIADTTTFSYTEDPFTSWLLGTLNRKISAQSVIQMQNIKTPTRDIGLYFEQYFSFTSSRYMISDTNALINLVVYPAGLSNGTAKGIHTNTFPWWIDLRNATISDSNN
ncbi:MAG: ABC transporter substrate-binding protein [Balneolaceae bacterium]|nr:ABC transporter substrate-binding protein [Balneolaceae bacterium]